MENSYNHNFKGTYCTCNRPYPDPDAEEEEEMVQCCICEDWYHREHLGLESSEKVGVSCMLFFPLLKRYVLGLVLVHFLTINQCF